LGCTGFARIDMFLMRSSEIVFSEANTIPGFTVYSQYPKMMSAIGLTLEQILDRAIEWAVKKI
jgi:D-alanine-D-alanine ligase-like ATP-grasp enzyme